MCGYIGVVGEDAARIETPLDELESILRHRGPDHSGCYRDNRCLLIHNRLSIIDLSDDANQPFVSDETGNIILFNGEIYNYQELKCEYPDIDWKTSSDTEVIIKLYDHLGETFVEKLNGIFAFAILDFGKNRLFLCRDRFGVKPLYYRFKRDGIQFASEIKGLLAFMTSCELDHEVVYDYLEFGLLGHNERTFVKGVRSLPPATYLAVELDTWKSHHRIYWDVGFGDQSYRREDDILEEAMELLRDAVRLNLVSDVDIALSLSSGLDSSLLYHLLRDQGAEQMTAFTFGFRDRKYDEIWRVQDHNFVHPEDHRPVRLAEEEMIPLLEEAITYFEFPIGGIGTLATYKMLKTVREAGIKVLLTGEGSDEVFGGYQYYIPAHLSDITLQGEVYKRECRSYQQSHGIEDDSIGQIIQKWNHDALQPGVLAPDATSLSSHYGSKSLLDRVTGRGGKDEEPPRRFLSRLKSAMYMDLKYRKIPKLLLYRDRSAMASGVEVRVPYLDHRLVELMYAAPSRCKIRNGQTKVLARRILEEGFGVRVNERLKHYVATPQREWLKDILYEEVRGILEDGLLVRSGLIRVKRFFEDYETYHRGHALGNSFFVWKMLNMEFMLRSFFSTPQGL